MSEKDVSKESNVKLWSNIDEFHSKNRSVHSIALNDLYKQYHCNPDTGLSNDFVSQARIEYGENRLTPSKSPNYFWLLFKQLFTGFNSILWLAGILTILAYKPFGGKDPSITNLALGIVLFIVIIFNSILNVYQEIKSIKIVASFSKLLPTIATVRRDGQEQQIFANEIVPGDIILIRMGDKIPADCRFILCDNLKINTSQLTGESKPVSATTEYTSEVFMESRNIGYYSSLVEEGTGEAIVISTGDNTILGRMSKLTQQSSGDEITGLHREVNRFVLFVVIATIIAILVLWITWVAWLNIKHHSFVSYTENIVNSAGMIVAFLPMGLPSAVTLALTIVAKQMYAKRVLVKSLQIIETFNCVSIVATDKTGTLTQNKMTIGHLLWDTFGVYRVPLPETKPVATHRFFKAMRRLSDGTFKFIRRFSLSKRSNSERLPLIDNISAKNTVEPSEIHVQAFRDLLLGAVLCNNAEKQIVKDVDLDQNGTHVKSVVKLVGDAADTALYNLCRNQCSVNVERVRTVNQRLKVLPFNSINKFMITANQLETLDESIPEHERRVIIFMKGAPDIILQRCSTYKTDNDEILPFNADIQQKIMTRLVRLGENGYRVIGLCQQKLIRQQYDDMMQESKASISQEDLLGFPSKNYCFIGLFSLYDPPRPEVPDAVLKARQAQIRIAMVTGDHPTTAKAIAKQVNIFSQDTVTQNGIDSFQIDNDINGKLIFNLYRNGNSIQQHYPTNAKSADSIVSKSIIENLTMKNDILPIQPKLQCIPFAIIVTGDQIDLMDDFMWNWVVSHKELIFARTSPEQKLRIVKELQRRSEIVAVTGDGTNDAPALKCADLGVAMQSGTEVSKEASDMILLDDNFASIIQAIETGRLLSDNLKKVAIYLLPGGSWSQVWPIFFHLWFGIPLALPAFLATIFCMLNDVFMSLAMVKEKSEFHIMSRPPSVRSKDHLLNWKLLLHAYMFVGNFECFTAFFCFCYYLIDNGIPFYSFMFSYEKFMSKNHTKYEPEQLLSMIYTAQSIYYCSVCLFQFFNYLATRTRYTSIFQHNPLWGKNRNIYMFIAMLLSILIQIFVTQIVWINKVFRTTPVPVKYVAPTIGFGMLWLIIDELRKWLVRTFPHSFVAKIAW